MNYIRITQILLISISFLYISCEHITESEENIPQQNTTGKLAVFNFEKGNKLELIQGKEENKPIIIALETSPESQKQFIDFDSYTILDVYLKLTSEEHPVPKILLDLFGSDKNSENLQTRSIVDTFHTPLHIYIEEIPKTLLQQASVNRAFCDNNTADYCSGGDRSKNEWWQSYNKYKKIENSTQLPENDNWYWSRMLVRCYYRNSFGNWKENDKARHYVYPGFTTRVTYTGGSKRYRAVRRTLDRGDYVIWNGWTDFRN